VALPSTFVLGPKRHCHNSVPELIPTYFTPPSSPSDLLHWFILGLPWSCWLVLITPTWALGPIPSIWYYGQNSGQKASPQPQGCRGFLLSCGHHVTIMQPSPPAHLIHRPLASGPGTWGPNLFSSNLFLSELHANTSLIAHSGPMCTYSHSDLEANCMCPYALFASLSLPPPCGELPSYRYPLASIPIAYVSLKPCGSLPISSSPISCISPVWLS